MQHNSPRQNVLDVGEGGHAVRWQGADRAIKKLVSQALTGSNGVAGHSPRRSHPAI
jgi:hypothetical protein